MPVAVSGAAAEASGAVKVAAETVGAEVAVTAGASTLCRQQMYSKSCTNC